MELSQRRMITFFLDDGLTETGQVVESANSSFSSVGLF
jgi:hypothetical protein